MNMQPLLISICIYINNIYIPRVQKLKEHQILRDGL